MFEQDLLDFDVIKKLTDLELVDAAIEVCNFDVAVRTVHLHSGFVGGLILVGVVVVVSWVLRWMRWLVVGVVG